MSAVLFRIRYSAIDGDVKSNTFVKIERTVTGLIEDGFFRLDPEGLRWWQYWLRMHQPRAEDGGCAALDAAATVTRRWPRANASPALPQRTAEPTMPRVVADGMEHTGYLAAARARAQANLDEANPSTRVITVVPEQLIVFMYDYTTDSTKRVALGQVVAVSTKLRVHWMVRSEKRTPLDEFSVNGHYRKARRSDYGRDQEDESQFDVDREDLICVLCKTKAQGEDQPITKLNDSGTIPNIRLATGVSLREYIAQAVADQGDKVRLS